MKGTFQFLLLVGVEILAASAQQDTILNSSISVVHVDTLVQGKDGRSVTGLSRADFRVLDNGAEQSVAAFASGQEALDLILLFDVSSSMKAQIQKVAMVANDALRELRSGDRVAVMTFDRETRSFSGFMENHQSIQDELHRISLMDFKGGTRIEQAVDDAANRFFRDRGNHQRRAVLIFTDNLSLRDRNEKSILNNLWEADAQLSGLIFHRWAPARIFRPSRTADIGGVKYLAEQTGGEAIESDDPSSSFAEMMHRIRTRYSIYYEMPDGKPGTYRDVRVELADKAKASLPDAHVSARRGYYIPDTNRR